MDDHVTISTFQVFEEFSDAECARLYFEARRWHGHVVCPHCGCDDRITARKGKRLGYYRCRDCKQEFTVRTGTIFERSHVPLHKWLYAMYLVVTARKGISSMQLSKEIGVTQKTAWFLLGRLREACGGEPPKLGGVVEIDETYVGGKEANKHASKRLHVGGGTGGKQAVVGARELGGRVNAQRVERVDADTVVPLIEDAVKPGATVYTDDASVYGRLSASASCYRHEAVAHSRGEFARGSVHTNGIESFWALFKRSLHGTWHHVSPKHLHRYVDEAAFRLNEGNVRIHTLDRLASFAEQAFRHRLTYKELTA